MIGRSVAANTSGNRVYGYFFGYFQANKYYPERGVSVEK